MGKKKIFNLNNIFKIRFMTIIKLGRTSSYFGRFQVKYRRRREGKTDYRARVRLISQDKRKYNLPKNRLIVRFSNKDITTQIAYATVAGDNIICSAYAHELPTYGLNVGLTNFSASYCVGLLCARRCLNKFGLDQFDNITKETNGYDPVQRVLKHNEEKIQPNSLRVVLDTGLKKTSLGSKVFSVLKGAVDGGLKIPHTYKRFIGYDKTVSENKYDPDTMNKYIHGSHISQYMEELKEEEADRFCRQFSQYLNYKIKPDDLDKLYKKVQAEIIKTPLKLIEKTSHLNNELNQKEDDSKR